ncbi:MAG: alpha/beta hydrolase [Maribacter sp.]
MLEKRNKQPTEIHFKKFGVGSRTLVLLHYFGGNADSWQWVVKRIKDEFTIYVITLPGFGNTPPLKDSSIYDYAAYINQCIETLKLKNFMLCGHSMSGKLILYADQITNGVKAKALVLIAPSPPTVERMTKLERARRLPRPMPETAEITIDKSTVKALMGKRRKTAIDSQLETHGESWRWWLTTGMNNNISDRIKGISTPTFVICAKEDPIIPMNDIYNEVLPYLYKPKLIQLGGCGHLIPMEAPRRLSKRIRKIANNVLSEQAVK